jgi:predicted nucleotidyltransferase
MRLTENEINIIRNEIKRKVGDCKIYIFGSRVDDNVKGGDVDIYIDKNFDLKTELKFKKELKIILEEKLFFAG